MLLNLTDKTTVAYDKINNTVTDLKSHFLNLCGEINRFFNVNFGVLLTEKTPITKDEKFDNIFPNLKNATETQLEQLFGVFCKIRNLNAHLFLSFPITIPSELQEFLSTLPKPEYEVTVDGKLTIFGMIYILSLLAQKYQLTPFLFEVLRNKYFYKIVKQEKVDILTRLQNYFYSLCGKGKPSFVAGGGFDSLDVQNFTTTTKQYLTKVFFGIEKCTLKWTLSAKTEPPFDYLLYKNSPFKENNKLNKKLLKLRKQWINGVALFDEVNDDGFIYTFTLNGVISVLSELKTILSGKEDYALVVSSIKEFGEKLYAFYTLRLIEISYKILDKTLFMEEKIEDRAQSAIKAVERIKQADLEFFALAEKLVGNDAISCSINAGRFGDKLPRVFETDTLKILKIISSAPIKIGEFQTSLTELQIALVSVDGENLNLINGISPLDLKGEITQTFSSKISLYSVKLD